MSTPRKLSIAMSGGRTSAMMCYLLLKECRELYDDIVVIFCNTGCEHEATLEFIQECDRTLGFNTVWIEAVVHHGEKRGCTSKVVDFQTADRKGTPYAEAVAKYGIFNMGNPVCTDRLKMMPLRHYLRDVLGWKRGDHHHAVGIRADEIDRMSIHAERDNIIYPLIAKGITKNHVLTWWQRMPFDLQLDDHYGNCVWCWKKTDRKLFTIAREAPHYFDLPAHLEEKHKVFTNGKGVTFNNQTFFRKGRSAAEIIATSQRTNTGWMAPDHERQTNWLDELDLPAGCSDSCDAQDFGGL